MTFAHVYNKTQKWR